MYICVGLVMLIPITCAIMYILAMGMGIIYESSIGENTTLRLLCFDLDDFFSNMSMPSIAKFFRKEGEQRMPDSYYEAMDEINNLNEDQIRENKNGKVRR